MKTITEQFDLLIGGEIKAPVKGEYFDCVNPSNGRVIASIANATKDDMDQAIASAYAANASGVWSSMSTAERGIYLKKIAGVIRDNAKELADIESESTGKLWVRIKSRILDH